MSMRQKLHSRTAPRMLTARKPTVRAQRRTRRLTACARAFETLLGSCGIIALTLDSATRIRRLDVPAPGDVRSAIALLAGRTLREVFEPEVCDFLVTACRQSLTSGEPQEFGCLLYASGRPRWVSVTARLVKARPRPNFHLFVRDVSKTSEVRLDTQNPGTLLEHASDFAQIGSWEADLRACRFSCSPRLIELLREEGNRTARVTDFVWRVIQACCENFRKDGSNCTVSACERDIEIPRLSGGRQILHVSMVCVYPKAGLPSQFGGVVQDVTSGRRESSRLQASEALLLRAERVSNLGTWDLDVRTGESAWSDGLVQLLKLPAAGAPSSDAYWQNVAEDDRARAQDALSYAVRQGVECAYAVRFRRPTGEWRLHETHAIPVRTAAGELIRVAGLVQDITEERGSESALRQLSQKLMRARDLERRLTARELHETVGQTLASLKMALGNLRNSPPEKAGKLFDDCRELADAAAREIRTVSYLMHPPLLDEAGLVSALRWFVRGFSERSKIDVALTLPDDFPRLDREIENTLFRLVQEALTNVHRYSGSRTAQIRISGSDGQVHLEVKDQGCGLARPAYCYLAEPAGVGIPGMRERVRELNGVLEIESAPGQGTTIRAALPHKIASRENLEAMARPELCRSPNQENPHAHRS